MHSVDSSGIDSTASFDPMAQGTEESAWAGLLAATPAWSPDDGPLVVVAPHPDDEVLGAGGLIRSWAARGASVTVLSVSDGEAAHPGWHALGSVRREELNEALRTLSPSHVTVRRLGLPDGQIACHLNRLRNAILSLVGRFSDGSRLTLIAPYEGDGHPDHEAVGKVCVEVARAERLAIARYAIWAWHRASPATLRDARWGRFALSDDARRAKARAVQCFKSQVRPEWRDPIVPPHVLSHFDRPYEAFLL
jgi:LmbE family N-acetylglucosaminyl deacetylase